MKVLTLWQPWASLLAAGIKRHETRSWSTNYRGLLLVHAAASEPLSVLSVVCAEPALQLDPGATTFDARSRAFRALPRGAVVGVVRLDDVQPISEDRVRAYRARSPGNADEIKRGDWSAGRFAWACTALARVDPIAHAGAQGLRDAPTSLVRAVLEDLERSGAGGLALRTSVRLAAKDAEVAETVGRQGDLFGGRRP